jgi:hypothetical protein
MIYGPLQTPALQTDSKAIISLVLGLLGMFCCTGIITGIPAIIVGVMSQRDISRSGGTLGGGGLAISGIITGGLTTLGTIAYIALNVAMFSAIGKGSRPSGPPPYVPPTAYVAPLSAGAIHTVELSRATGSLEAQLVGEIGQGAAAGETTVLYIYSKGATACSEFDAALPDAELQRVLSRVRLVRAEASEFSADLSSLGLSRPSYPWFWRVAQKPKSGGGVALWVGDGISADEWDDNEAANMAPVLESFVNGTYPNKSPARPLPGPPPKLAPKPHHKSGSEL